MRGALVVLLIVLGGCGTGSWSDRLPPRLLESEISEDGKEIQLRFDEPIASAEASVDGASTTLGEAEGPTVPLLLPQGLEPGSGHVWEAEVVDASRNTSSVAGKFYAPNEDPATLRLNEVRVAGSGSRSDFVELRVEREGGLGGWTLEAWTGPKARQRLVLPDLGVHAGELIVVRFRPPEEPTDTVASAHEYWLAEAKGLSPTKGAIVLRQHPDGPVAEALVYSKKAGEGSTLAEAAGLASTEELDPTGCTPTRTWSRVEGGWIITATGGATPGAPNSLTPWAGPPSSRGGSTTTKERRKRRGLPR